jgi:hypothetical protein
MKYTIQVIGLVSLVFLAGACRPKGTASVVQEPGEVVFSRAGIALTVGEGWQRIDADPGIPVCPPTLVSRAGMVRAMIFDANRPDPQSAATRLRASFEADADSDKTSFRQEEFTTASGLTGVHLSYSSHHQKGGTVTEMRSHNYIVKNKDGRCVAISYIVSAGAESDSVHQMVRKTLRLQ